MIADNYASADYINFPKRPPKKIEFMDDGEAKIFFKTVMNYPNIRYKTAMLLFLLTGFRRGEVAGLQWSDINFEDKTITISRSYTSISGYGSVLKEPKTEKSTRTITVADTLVTALKEYRDWWEQHRKDLGDYMQENDYLFTQENGKRLHPSGYTFWLNTILKAAGLDHYSIHSLRHTNITMQIAAGVPIVTVAARAGHARPSTTSDIYAHFIKSSDQSAATMIDNIFSNEAIETLKRPEQQQKESQIQDIVDELLLDDEKTKDRPPEYGSESAEYFKQVKAEMKKFGFETIEEYEEYVAYVERKMKKIAKERQREKDNFCM